MSKEFIALSGGLDSTMLAHHLLDRQNLELSAIYVNHGQFAAKSEIVAAKQVADYLQIDLKVIDCSGLWPSFEDVAGERFHLMTSSAISPSPGILIAATYAAWAGAKTLYLGLVKEDVDGRPWLLDLISKYNAALACIRPSLVGFPPGGNEFDGFKIRTPFSQISKSDMVRNAIETHSLGVVETLLKMTWSCQFSVTEECGSCFICKLKADSITNGCSSSHTVPLNVT